MGGVFGGSKTPFEQEETGFSNSIASTLEVISEGVIQGLKNGGKSIFLDETPVLRNDGKSNFKGFRYRTRRGGSVNTPFPGFESPQNETNVGVEVKSTASVTRSIINDQLDSIRFRLGVRLLKREKDGDVRGTSVEFRILCKEGNGAFVERIRRTISGKYSDTREFEIQFNVKNLNNTVNRFQWRVEKITTDSTDKNHVREISVQAVTEITQAKMTYPHTALVGMEFDAKQFNSVPNRAFQVGGLLVRIPTNATVRSDASVSYSGVWDGTFYTPTVAVNCPVWNLYEILTNKRWGLGNYLDESRIDKWSLYQASVYCNELINDGLGGTEARYQISTVLNTKLGVLECIDSICSTANIKFYWDGGIVKFWQDRPGTVIRQFTQSDVEKGRFVYASTAIRTRNTVARVAYSDPTNFYKQDIEIVEDKPGIAKYGVREKDVIDFGGCSRGQAVRKGRWFLYSSLKQTETVNFAARAYAAFVRPGDIIEIADSSRSNIRLGGLIKEGSTTSLIKLDSPTQVFANSSVSVMLPYGAIETRTVSNSGLVTELNLTAPLSVAPKPESNFIIKNALVNPQTFRVLSVTPTPNNPTKVNIMAIAHNPNKYLEIESNIILPTLPTRLFVPNTVSVPTNLIVLSIGLVTDVNKVIYKLEANWKVPFLNSVVDPYINYYIAEYKRGVDGLYSNRISINSTSASWDNVPSGEYYVRVAAIDIEGKISNWVESGVVTVNTDIDADTASYQNRLNAVGVTISQAHLIAVDNFVKGVYAAGLRGKDFNTNFYNSHLIQDCCVFAGNTINGVKLWAMRNSPDEVSLTNFVAGDYSSVLGLDPGTTNTNKIADTGVNPSSMFSLSSPLGSGDANSQGHLGVFSTKDGSAQNTLDIGVEASASSTMSIVLKRTDNNAACAIYNPGSNFVLTPNTNSRGYYVVSRTSTTDLRFFKNGSQIGTTNTTTQNGTRPNATIKLFANNSNKSIGMYHLGSWGMTPTQVSTLNTLVSNLMAALGRV